MAPPRYPKITKEPRFHCAVPLVSLFISSLIWEENEGVDGRVNEEDFSEFTPHKASSKNNTLASVI